jgi:hypothetical protein
MVSRGPYKVRSVRERFWSFVPETPDDGCWPWYGAPSFSYGPACERHFMRAHRMAWQLANRRAVPKGKVVRRICENARCVRPDHLELTTMSAIQSESPPHMRFGAANARTKLSDDDVLLIRALAREGWSMSRIALRFGIARSYAHNIVSRRRRDTVYEWTRQAA